MTILDSDNRVAASRGWMNDLGASAARASSSDGGIYQVHKLEKDIGKDAGQPKQSSDSEIVDEWLESGFVLRQMMGVLAR